MGYNMPLKNNIAYTYSAHGSTPVVAIHDALLILHAGSATGDEGLVLEGRKRYVIAVNGLRLGLGESSSATSLGTVLVVAMGVLMSEVLLSREKTPMQTCHQNALEITHGTR